MGNANTSLENIFIQKLSTKQAEDWLTWEEANTGDFLVRTSKDATFTLSVRSGPKRVKHFAIIEDEMGRFAIGDAKGLRLEKKKATSLKGIQADSIEALIEGYVKGGPYAKQAYEHFGCFLLRVASSPPPAQTAPPPAFFFAASSQSGFGNQSKVLTGKARTSTGSPGSGGMEFGRSVSVDGGNVPQPRSRNGSTLATNNNNSPSKPQGQGVALRKRSNTLGGEMTRPKKQGMQGMQSFEETTNEAEDAYSRSRRGSTEFNDFPLRKSGSLDLLKETASDDVSERLSGVWGGSDDESESVRSSGVWQGEADDPNLQPNSDYRVQPSSASDYRVQPTGVPVWQGSPDNDDDDGC